MHAAQELARVLLREVGRCEALLDSEPDRAKCKWPLLTLARLHELLQRLAGDLASEIPHASPLHA